jgi:hypothetical protein
MTQPNQCCEDCVSYVRNGIFTEKILVCKNSACHCHTAKASQPNQSWAKEFDCKCHKDIELENAVDNLHKQMDKFTNKAQPNQSWAKEFDDKFPTFDGGFSAIRELIKQFIRQQIDAATQEAYWEGVMVMTKEIEIADEPIRQKERQSLKKKIIKLFEDEDM